MLKIVLLVLFCHFLYISTLKHKVKIAHSKGISRKLFTANNFLAYTLFIKIVVSLSVSIYFEYSKPLNAKPFFGLPKEFVFALLACNLLQKIELQQQILSHL